ncbi:histidine triad (HIT) protein [Floricoccus penangensis]|uniref:Histidine triad (HIT) protein n=1 Tax=Floricoccus penangensis TaxID=1859475 RepID=A0A9Q5JHK5_9LACT|nr:HIT family protein [Floricoccus penangensis]OFI47672.1 histidine triad (HIT) protein [Floricoccus penangensis]
MCIFCSQIDKKQILRESKDFFLVLDINPNQIGHLLLISKKHYESLEDIPDSVLLDEIKFEKEIVGILKENFDILDVTIFQNNGFTMDEGVHFHKHIIPRYKEDGFWDNFHVKEVHMDLEKLSELLKK